MAMGGVVVAMGPVAAMGQACVVAMGTAAHTRFGSVRIALDRRRWGLATGRAKLTHSRLTSVIAKMDANAAAASERAARAETAAKVGGWPHAQRLTA